MVIAVDTSGSVGDEELSEFLSEVKGIAEEVNPACVDLLYWGSDVVGHETYGDGEAANIIASTRPKGGGGTNPDVVADYMKEHKLSPDALVVLSDGYMHTNKSAWAHITKPTLWCILGNDGYEVPCGQKLVIKE